jgi:hypothetical protein
MCTQSRVEERTEEGKNTSRKHRGKNGSCTDYRALTSQTQQKDIRYLVAKM